MKKLIESMNILRNVYKQLVEDYINETGDPAPYQDKKTEKFLDDACEILNEKEKEK